jgi:hypothetical protein
MNNTKTFRIGTELSLFIHEKIFVKESKSPWMPKSHIVNPIQAHYIIQNISMEMIMDLSDDLCLTIARELKALKSELKKLPFYNERKAFVQAEQADRKETQRLQNTSHITRPKSTEGNAVKILNEAKHFENIQSEIN